MINQNKNNKNKICGVLVFLFVFCGLFFGINTFAANCGDYTTEASCKGGPDCSWTELMNKTYCRSILEINWPKSPMGTQLDSKSGISVVVKYLYEWGIGLGGIAAFISLIMSGFQYVSSAGNDSKMKDARDNINSALGGLLLLLSSFLVLNTINPQLVFLQKPENIRTEAYWPKDYMEDFNELEPNLCKKVAIYKKETCEGDPVAVIGPGEKATVTDPKAIKSLEGDCNMVNFYTSSNCDLRSSIGMPVSVVMDNCFSISSFPTTDPIRCISVGENVSYGVACDNDCTRCRDEKECKDSYLDSCCWNNTAQQCSPCKELTCSATQCDACSYLDCYNFSTCQWNDPLGKCEKKR